MTAMTVERVLLAEPRGFCAGVEMAIKALTWMTRIFDGPVYCFHEIVHNEWVVRAFEGVGVVFVNDIEQVPLGAPVMLSAHGSAPEVVQGAADRAAVVIDAVGRLREGALGNADSAAQDSFTGGLLDTQVPGGGRFHAPTLPLALDGVRLPKRSDPPAIGEGARVLLSGLGYADGDIEKLRAEGVVVLN